MDDGVLRYTPPVSSSSAATGSGSGATSGDGDTALLNEKEASPPPLPYDLTECRRSRADADASRLCTRWLPWNTDCHELRDDELRSCRAELERDEPCRTTRSGLSRARSRCRADGRRDGLLPRHALAMTATAHTSSRWSSSTTSSGSMMLLMLALSPPLMWFSVFVSHSDDSSDAAAAFGPLMPKLPVTSSSRTLPKQRTSGQVPLWHILVSHELLIALAQMCEQRNNPVVRVPIIEVQFTSIFAGTLCADLLNNDMGAVLQDTMIDISRVPVFDELVVTEAPGGVDQLLVDTRSFGPALALGDTAGGNDATGLTLLSLLRIERVPGPSSFSSTPLPPAPLLPLLLLFTEQNNKTNKNTAIINAPAATRTPMSRFLEIPAFFFFSAALTRNAVEAVHRGEHRSVRPIPRSIQVVAGHVDELKPRPERGERAAGHAVQRIRRDVKQGGGGGDRGVGCGEDAGQLAGEVVAGEVENPEPGGGEQRRRDGALEAVPGEEHSVRFPAAPSPAGSAPATAASERSSTASGGGSAKPNQAGISPGSANPEALKRSSAVRLRRPSSAMRGAAAPRRVRRSPATVTPTTRPPRHATPAQDAHGSDLSGQSRARSPRSARRLCSPARSPRDDSCCAWAVDASTATKMTRSCGRRQGGDMAGGGTPYRRPAPAREAGYVLVAGAGRGRRRGHVGRSRECSSGVDQPAHDRWSARRAGGERWAATGKQAKEQAGEKREAKKLALLHRSVCWGD
ncbi:hypothetical protein U9M48_011627 [Paspalum notatum var. saurae]|uniref:Uncharacterized protein n=1 Tax=Paspalum notatum var. saurae TaxID=547442 RepID=A0AAQ3WHK8_PASNO